MLSDGILQVVEETQVRGTVEKTYALAFNISDNMDAMVENNSGEFYMQYFMQYIFGFVKQFQEYPALPNVALAAVSLWIVGFLYLSILMIGCVVFRQTFTSILFTGGIVALISLLGSSKWVEDSTTEHSRWTKMNLSYGYLWWINEDGYAAMGMSVI